MADGSGGHVFAKSLKEHNINVVKWRKIERAKKSFFLTSIVESIFSDFSAVKEIKVACKRHILASKLLLD